MYGLVGIFDFVVVVGFFDVFVVWMVVGVLVFLN